MMTPEELDTIEARANAATLSPWRIGRSYARCNLPHYPHGRGECDYRVVAWDDDPHHIERYVPLGSPNVETEIICGNYDIESGGVVNESDAPFIAHARTDIPALIAEVRRLQGELEAHKEAYRVLEQAKKNLERAEKDRLAWDYEDSTVYVDDFGEDGEE